MNTGTIIALVIIIAIVYLAATGRLDSVWSAIKGG